MAKLSIEQQITERFLSIMNENVGPSRRWRYKKNFAEEVGMLPQDLNKLLNGATVQLRHLEKIHALTKVNLNWMITGRGEKFQNKKDDQSFEERLRKLEKVMLKK